jgi:hypothetical protein
LPLQNGTRQASFDLVTEWRFDVEPARVWPILIDVESWPSWWRAVRQVELLAVGDDRGIGAIWRLTWRTALPYQLTFDMETTRIVPMSTIEGVASGELTGRGLWTLRADGTGSHIRYDWQVAVTKSWMRALAPVLRRIFAWNHTAVMEWGRIGLLARLA